MKWQYPLASVRITQRFGENPGIYKQFDLKGHNGLDFGTRVGTELFAVADGVVVETGNQGGAGYGKYMRIHTNDGYEVTYGHLSFIILGKNETFKAGDKLAESGNTGYSTGPHLHLGVRKLSTFNTILNYDNGYKGAIDPLPFFMSELKAVVPLSEEHIAAIKFVSENHIMNNVATETLDDPISRQDMALVIHRLFKLIKG